MTTLVAGVHPLPASILHSGPYLVLVTFVAVNTVAFGALSLAKLLPPINPAAWFTSRDRRSETRSIHPDAPR